MCGEGITCFPEEECSYGSNTDAIRSHNFATVTCINNRVSNMPMCLNSGPWLDCSRVRTCTSRSDQRPCKVAHIRDTESPGGRCWNTQTSDSSTDPRNFSGKSCRLWRAVNQASLGAVDWLPACAYIKPNRQTPHLHAKGSLLLTLPHTGYPTSHGSQNSVLDMLHAPVHDALHTHNSTTTCVRHTNTTLPMP